MSDLPEEAAVDPSVVADLYQQEPSAFVASRNARAKELRSAGERAAARWVAGLRRPAPAAWGANLLAGASPDLIDAVLAAGARWRDASSSGDRSRTQAAQDDLRSATAEAVQRASDLMADRGRPARPDEVEALRSTLQAAAVDGDLAARLRAGTLEVPSAGAGFDGMAWALGAAPARPAPVARRRSPVDEVDAATAAVEEAAAARAAAEAAERAERRQLLAHAERLEEMASTLEGTADEAEREAARAATAAAAARQAAVEAGEAARSARAKVPRA